ncbi:hypothetical protein [Kitasatospora sp. NPDC051914]|uniref:hypothetical protein n=1 Tax=Kitasatospora sp. NPDC051914 TaxID=3154945 RepID=UPI003422A9D3
MSRINCPDCGRIDQVQSVPGLYEAQTHSYAGTTRGYGGGYGARTYYTSGSSSSLLADQIAPPPVPRLLQPTGGCALALMTALGLGGGVMVLPLLASGEPGAGRKALIVFVVLALPFLAAALALVVKRFRDRLKNRAAFRDYRARYPSLLAVWSTGFLCRRCHIAFIPAGALGLGKPRTVPVPGYQQLVAAVAADLRPT